MYIRDELRERNNKQTSRQASRGKCGSIWHLLLGPLRGCRRAGTLELTQWLRQTGVRGVSLVGGECLPLYLTAHVVASRLISPPSASPTTRKRFNQYYWRCYFLLLLWCLPPLVGVAVPLRSRSSLVGFLYCACVESLRRDRKSIRVIEYLTFDMMPFPASWQTTENSSLAKVVNIQKYMIH